MGKDKNPDIINEFLNQGKFMSIPVIVFYTKDLNHICHWIERSAVANREMAQIREQIQKEKPSATQQEFMAALRERTVGKQPEWQKSSVAEMRRMLAEKLKI